MDARVYRWQNVIYKHTYDLNNECTRSSNYVAANVIVKKTSQDLVSVSMTVTFSSGKSHTRY